MAKTYPIQHSFSAGEISPQLIARTDLEGYSQSAAVMQNMIPTIQGPCRSRFGFEFIAQAESANEQYCRMIPFQVSFSESYVIIITQFWIYIADSAGFSPSENLFLNSRFDNGSTDWIVEAAGQASVVFVNDTCVMASFVGQLASIRQQVTTEITEIAEVHLVGFRGMDAGPIRVMVGTLENGFDILDVTLTGLSDTAAFTPNLEDFWVEFQVPEAATKILDTVFCFNPSDDASLTRFPSPWVDPQHIEEIQFVLVPGEQIMYLFQRDTPPHYIDFIGSHVWDAGAITFEGGVGDDPPPWQPGAEDLGTVHPGSVAFYKGRMYVGGTNINDIGIWASAPGEFLDFLLPDADPEDGDPMYLPIDTDGDIMWLLGAKALFVGMDTGEHIIFGSGDAIPTPANVDTEQQSAYGSARIQAFKIGESVAFVTPDRRKLYLTSYVRDSLGWIGNDVSYPSEHITAGLLREIELSGTPDQILWFPTLDGELVGMIFDARREIVGWHHHTTQGFIVSTTVVKTRGIAELWIGVLRGAQGQPLLLHFEKAAVEKMDSYLVKTELVPTLTFTGFDHLEGQRVQILADGAVHRDLTVGFSGNVGELTLDYEALECVAGLGFLSSLKTLPIEMLSQSQSVGSYTKSWIKIFLKVLNSSRPLINGIRPPVRNEATPMNTREAYQSEDIEVANLGWDLDASILVEQDLPLRLEVGGIFGELDLQNIGED